MANDDDILGGFEPIALDKKLAEDDILGGFDMPRAKAKAVGATTSSPDTAGKAITLSGKTGVPATTIEADLPNFEQAEKAKKASEVVESVPAVSNYVEQNPLGAQVSSDDYESLQDIADKLNYARLSSVFNHTIEGIKQGFGPEQLGFSRENMLKYPSLYKTWNPFLAPIDFAFRGVSAGISGGSAFVGETARQAGMADAWAKRLERDLHIIGQGALIEAGQVTPMVPPEWNAIAKAAERSKTLKGEGYVSPETFLERAQGIKSRQEIEDFLAAKEARETAPKLLEGPKPPKVEEPAQLNPTATAMVQKGEMPAPGVDPIIDNLHISQQKLDAVQFDSAFNAVQESNTLKRAPDAMADYLGHVVGDQATISIPADKVMELYKGKAPSEGDGLLGYVPDLADQLRVGIETGTDVHISMAEFLARTDPKVYEELKENIRFRQEGVTKEEGKILDEQNKAAAEVAKVEKSQIDENVIAKLNEKSPELFTEPTFKELTAEAERDISGYDALFPQEQITRAAPGANVGRLALLLGPKLYGEPTNMAAVTVKELFQNSFDAVKAKLEDGSITKGKIDIYLGKDKRTIKVHDNGSGMTPEVMATKFLEIAGTVKETVAKSGGLGIAKMLYAFGNTGMRVTSARAGKISTMTTTGPELFASLEDKTLAPDINTRPLTTDDMKLFPEGHGSIIEVDIPKSFKDPSTGEQKEIEFSDYTADYKGLTKSPLFRDIDVNLITKKDLNDPKEYSYKNDLGIGSKFPKENYTQFANVNFDWGTARIYVSKAERKMYNENLDVLSNGIWQFSTSIKKNPREVYGENTPFHFIVDVDSKVEPEEAGYPFDLNRQGFAKSAKEDFGQIFNYMSRLYQQVDLASSAKNFGDVSYLDKTGDKVTVSTPKKLEPKVPQTPTTANQIQEGDEVTVVDGKLIVNGRQIPELTKEDLAKTAINVDELTIPQDSIDPNKVMLHDNLEVLKDVDPLEQVPYKGEPKGTRQSLVDNAREKFGERFDNYVYTIGKAFLDLRDVTARVMDYPELMKEGIGVSFDDKYYGVSIRIPFSGSFINPAIARYDTPIRAAVGMIGTMIHELAHHKIRSHEAEFPAEMQSIQILMDELVIKLSRGEEGQGAYDLVKAKADLADFMEKNYDIFQYLSKTIHEGYAKTRGKRFKEAGAYEGRDVGTPGRMEEPGGTALGPAYQSTGRSEGPPAVPPEDTGPVGAVKKSLYLDPLFKDNKAIGLTKPEFAKYSKKIEAADKAVADKMKAFAEKEARKHLSPEWKKNEAETKAEVESDIRSRPDMAADRYFRNGVLPTGERVERVYLDREIVEGMLGKGSIEAVTRKGGVSPDEIAPLLGYSTGAAMVKDLDLLDLARKNLKENPQSYFNRVVKQETERRMEEKYGTLQDNILAEATEAALSSHHADVLAEEIKQLAAAQGAPPPLSREQIEDWVKDKFAGLPIDRVSYENFRRGTERAGKDAEKGLLAGKFDEALQAKQRQLLAFLMAKEAKKFEKTKAKAEKSFNRVVKEDSIKSIDQQHLEHGKKILNNIGYTDKVGQEPDLPLPEFIAASEGQLAIAYWLANPDKPRVYEKLSTQEFDELAKSMESLLHNGKQVRLVENVHGAAELDNVIFDIKKELSRFDFVKQPVNPTVLQSIRSMGRFITASHLLVERMLDYTDKFDPHGPITSYLDRPLRDSYSKELALGEQVAKRLSALNKEVTSGINDFINNKYILDPMTGEPMNLTRKNLRHLILHMGSESGLEKVTKGFDVDQISLWNLVRENADASDFRWAEGMWSMFDMLWDESSQMQKRYTGVAADSVAPRPITMKLKDGTKVDVSGGYAPIFYDKTRSNIEGDIAKKSSLFDVGYTPAVTPQAYTIPRTKYAAPLDLTGAMFATKIQGMVHDIAFREAVRNASKMINNPEFMRAMTQRWGKEYSGLLYGWLKDIANVHNVDDSYAIGAAHFFSSMRQNITSSLIYLNPGTYMKHGGTAAAMSVAQTGLKNFAKATKDLGTMAVLNNAKALLTSEKTAPLTQEFIDALKDVSDIGQRGVNTREFILGSSAVMRNRQRSYADTIRGAYDQVNYAGPSQWLADARQISLQVGRFPVALSDTLSAMPTWLAAYKRSFAEGNVHADAVFEADRAVARAHGSNFIGDKSRIMRTGEPMRWVTPLFGFWNHMGNNMMQYAWDISATARRGRGSEPGANISSLMNRMFLYVILPIAIEELASPALDTHGQSLGRQLFAATLRYLGSFFIGLRDVTNAAFYGYEPSVGLIGTIGKSLVDTARDARQLGTGKAVSKDWLTHLATAIGMATGFGGAQVGRTATGVVGKLSGRERPRSAIEWRQLMRTGHTKARIH